MTCARKSKYPYKTLLITIALCAVYGAPIYVIKIPTQGKTIIIGAYESPIK